LRLNVDILQLQELFDGHWAKMSISGRWQPAGLTPPRYQKRFYARRQRLLDVMERPLDARILGKQIIREILYYVLTGPCGGAFTGAGQSPDSLQSD